MRRILHFIPPMMTVAAAVGGVTATRMIPGYAARFFPQLLSMGPAGQLAVKAAAATLAGWATSMIGGSKMGQDVALGGFISVADEAFQTYVAPSLGLQAYLQPVGVGAYLTPGGVGHYLGPGATVPGVGDELSQYLDDDETAGGIVSRLDSNQRL